MDKLLYWVYSVAYKILDKYCRVVNCKSKSCISNLLSAIIVISVFIFKYKTLPSKSYKIPSVAAQTKPFLPAIIRITEDQG